MQRGTFDYVTSQKSTRANVSETRRVKSADLTGIFLCRVSVAIPLSVVILTRVLKCSVLLLFWCGCVWITLSWFWFMLSFSLILFVWIEQLRFREWACAGDNQKNFPNTCIKQERVFVIVSQDYTLWWFVQIPHGWVLLPYILLGAILEFFLGGKCMQIAVLEEFSQVIRRNAYSIKINPFAFVSPRFINSHVAAVFTFTFGFSRTYFFLSSSVEQSPLNILLEIS